MEKFKKQEVLIFPDGKRILVKDYCIQIGETERVYKNDKYLVFKRELPLYEPPKKEIVHLSVKRIDRQPIHDWRELQDIKNELIGVENQAVEIYPAESDLVDMANQYHIWGFIDPKARLPFGFTNGRMVSGADEAKKHGAVQRPFDHEAVDGKEEEAQV